MNKQNMNNCDKACAQKQACATKACDKGVCEAKQAALKLDAKAGIDNAENMPGQPAEFEQAELANLARLKHNEELIGMKTGAGACANQCAGACTKGAKAAKSWAAGIDTENVTAQPAEFEQAEVANFARLKHNEELMGKKAGACEKQCSAKCAGDKMAAKGAECAMADKKCDKAAKNWAARVDTDNVTAQPAEFEQAEVANFARLKQNEALMGKKVGACGKTCAAKCAGDKMAAKTIADVNTDNIQAQPAEFEQAEVANFARLKQNEALIGKTACAKKCAATCDKAAACAKDMKPINTNVAGQPAEFEQAELANLARLKHNEELLASDKKFLSRKNVDAERLQATSTLAADADRNAAIAAWEKSDSAALERRADNAEALGLHKQADLTLDSTMKYTERHFQTKDAQHAATKLDKHANLNVTKVSDVLGADRIGNAHLIEQARRA